MKKKNPNISLEQRKRIESVINYIFRNLFDDLSLEKLAEIANYSPFHFHKLFKEITGYAPKNYIIQLRMETVAHQLLIFKHKSITEISADCGFSSPSVFTRSFKNYFSITPDEIRDLPPDKQLSIRKDKKHLKSFFECHCTDNTRASRISIEVKKLPSITGIFANASLKDVSTIQRAFKEIIKFAQAHELITDYSKFIGLIYPHQNLYRVFVSINPFISLPKKIETYEIKSGKYAVFKNTGTIDESFKLLGAFNEVWLPDSGYKIADISGFEIYKENPCSKPYEKIEKEIYIKIEPI